MKKTAILFFLLNILSFQYLFAYDFKLDGIYYNVVSEEEQNIVEVTYKAVTEDGYVENDYSGNIIIPSSVKYKDKDYIVIIVGDYAFRESNNLVSVVIPESVRFIGKYAFDQCGMLESVSMPDKVEAIEKYAFAYCRSLKSITIPESVRSLGDGIFSNCIKLDSVDISGLIEVLPAHSFDFCSKLVSVTLPSSLKKIKTCAFQHCRLNTIDIPASVEKIEIYAFQGCPLTEVVNRNPTPQRIVHKDPWVFMGFKDNCILKVPVESVEAYRAAPGWNKFSSIVGL